MSATEGRSERERFNMVIVAETTHSKSSVSEIPPQEVASALQDSLSPLRPLEKDLFDSRQVASGLLLGLVKVILLRFQHGLPANRSQFLSVLETAKSVPCEKR